MYQAELHKNETVLTAAQSDTLRGMGILSANSDGTPNLNFPTPNEDENPINSGKSVLSQPIESEQKPMNFEPLISFEPNNNILFPTSDKNEKPMNLTPLGLPQTINNVSTPPPAVNNESYENNQSSISVPVSLSVTVNAAAEKAQNIERKIRELVPRIVQQVISDILDEDLQTL